MPTYGVKLKIGLRNVAIGEGTNGLRAVIHTQLDSGNYLEIAQTETQFHSRDPDFVQRVSLQYRFDRVCRIKTEVYAVRDATSEALEYKIGEAIVDLPVLLANASHLCLPINEYQAFVDLQLEVPDFYKHTAQMRFVASHLHAPSHCPSIAAYYVLLLVLEKRTIMLYKSEVIPSKNPEWQQFSIPLYIVQFYQQASLQIHVYNYNPNHEDVLIGQVSTIWTQLQRGPGPLNSYMLLNHEGRRKDEKMSLDLLLLEQGQGVSFFDMVSQNLRIHLGVAVDFTASNGDPTQPESLHYIHPHRPNSYISVMLKQLPPVLGHSKDIRITAIGFGAKVGPNHQLSHCFSLDSNSPDFHVNGFEGLLNAYRRARLEVMPFAPTEFADAVYHMSNVINIVLFGFAKASTRLKMGMYFILLILTDGDITNAKATRDALADACDAPLSVIAIGLGEEKSFDKIRSLESPSMKHSDGRLISRQVLSFVRSVDVEEDDAVALLPFRMQQWNLLNLNKTTS